MVNASKESDGPGFVSSDGLKEYWGLPSSRAVMTLARKLGLSRSPLGYSWLSVWQAEGLGPPPGKHWKDLKRPLLSVEKVAAIVDRSPRTVRRWIIQKPDDRFPDPVFLSANIRGFREVQILTWKAGARVPQYPKLSSATGMRPQTKILRKTMAAAASVQTPVIFDPFAVKIPKSVTNDKMRPK